MDRPTPCRDRSQPQAREIQGRRSENDTAGSGRRALIATVAPLIGARAGEPIPGRNMETTLGLPAFEAEQA